MLQSFATRPVLAAVDKDYTAAAAAADQIPCRHDIQSRVHSIVAIT